MAFPGIQMMWVERTILTTSFPLPGILRWFPVTSVETVIKFHFYLFFLVLLV